MAGLLEWTGDPASQDIILVGATNRPDRMDNALNDRTRADLVAIFDFGVYATTWCRWSSPSMITLTSLRTSPRPIEIFCLSSGPRPEARVRSRFATSAVRARQT